MKGLKKGEKNQALWSIKQVQLFRESTIVLAGETDLFMQKFSTAHLYADLAKISMEEMCNMFI